MLTQPARGDALTEDRVNGNQAISTLKNGLPLFTTQVQGGAGFAEGKQLASTQFDFVTYEMEHGTFDVAALRSFMLGLAEGAGPNGTRIPVLVTLPLLGTDPQVIRANSWMIRQVLAAGVSGILLCQAESAEAVRIFVEATRYPFARGAASDVEHRGFRSEDFALRIWGTSRENYLEKADPWPLNPHGELLLGIKIESPMAALLADELLSVPGIAMVEWAPGDQSFFLLPKPYTISRQEALRDPRMIESRDRVSAAAGKRNVATMALCAPETVVKQLRSGIRICYANDNVTIERGRALAEQAKTVPPSSLVKP